MVEKRYLLGLVPEADDKIIAVVEIDAVWHGQIR